VRPRGFTTQGTLALGLLAFGGLLAVLGASAGATLTFLLGAALAGITDAVTRRWGALPETDGATADEHDLDPATAPPPDYAQGRPVARVEWDPAGHPASGAAPSDLGQMSDQALCQAWRISYIRIRRLQQLPHAGAALGRASIERGHYLNEIERRYPAGFSAWMAAGARAASDPSRFLGLDARRTARPGDAPGGPAAERPTTLPDEPDQDIAS
jgi:hypothetical protein